MEIEESVYKEGLMCNITKLCMPNMTLFLPNSCHTPTICKRSQIIVYGRTYVINTGDQMLVIDLECHVQM